MTPTSMLDEFAPAQPATAGDQYTGFAPRDEVAATPAAQATAEPAIEEYAQPMQSPPAEDPWLPSAYEAPEAAYPAEAAWEHPAIPEPEAAPQADPGHQAEWAYQAPPVQQPEIGYQAEAPSDLPALQQPEVVEPPESEPETAWGEPESQQADSAASVQPHHEEPAAQNAAQPTEIEVEQAESKQQSELARQLAPTYQNEPAYEDPAVQQAEIASQVDTAWHEPAVLQTEGASQVDTAWDQPAAQQADTAREAEPANQADAAWDQPAAQQAEPAWEQEEVQTDPVPQPEATYQRSQQVASAPPVELPMERPSPPAEPEWDPEPAAAVDTPLRAAERRTAATAREQRLTIQTMDLHCAGEPLRIIRSGFPEVPNLPVLERRRWVMQNADHIRRAVIHEPRGHHDMYGAILLPPNTDYADMTVLFMHNEGYSTMCGHGIIAITTGLIEEGLFPATEPVTTIRYEVPAGIVAANAATVQLENGEWAVQGVRFTNVPSYLAAQSLSVRPDGIQLQGSAAQYGALSVDLAFGGAYYGIVNASELGLRVVPEQAEALRRAGAAITDVLRRDHGPSHPTDPSLGFVYGTIIVDLDPRSSPDGRATNAHMRNATIFADAELDRSPCGSGTSAILAQLHARGRIKVGQEIINAGITGEHFLGRVEAETALGPYPAVSTSIAGTAYVTGFATFIVDNRDPLGEGFLLR